MRSPVVQQRRNNQQEIEKAPSLVVQKIRGAILDETFKPGERLPEERVGKMFNVSRSPVREVLLALEKEGTVVMEPYKGATVKPLSPEEAMDVAALSFMQGLLVVLKDSGHPGMVLVLDEVETLQRVRADSREKALNALRQLIDELDAGRFPGLLLVITGTPSFFDGPQGMRKLPPLAQRLHTDFDTDIRFDNPRAPQIRLKPFDFEMLMEVGRKVRDIFADGSSARDRIYEIGDDALIESLAKAVSGTLGGKTGIAPRIFLKKLVTDILDRIELYETFDPRKDYRLTIRQDELSAEERNLMPASSVEDIRLEL